MRERRGRERERERERERAYLLFRSLFLGQAAVGERRRSKIKAASRDERG